MKPDISNRDDIVKLVSAFYDKVKADNLLSVFFFKVVPVDWEKHSERMVDFWDNVLFFTGRFEGNPLQTHQSLYKKKPTKKVHFDRWAELFDATIDERFEGTNAEKLKTHAKAIGEIMQQIIK